ncbi:MAG TPA: BadF/BadG/BcrA/BcrD ATPase family protein [Lacipirellulaceae bacterium]|jgi:N-acetylglucosamine kinase-like BadF-type ATPase|nr:BadF/BadG/BcrA/BcrD ATPase family protein [Lacipirellulaceae bacterium]
MGPASDASISNPSSPDRDLVVVVDTGGTKTAAWLVDSQSPTDYRRLGEARTSAGNPLSVGFEKATQAIYDAINLARKSAGFADVRACRAVLSIAGAANREMTARFVSWCKTIPIADQIAIVSDVLPILAAGTPDCCGVALISGTGSSAFGRAADGTSKRCGGWGYLLGDEGSGYALGRGALQHTLRSLETGDTDHGFSAKVITELGVKTVTELTRTIYGGGDPRHAVAALSKIVCNAADEGDATANGLLDIAAAELADLAARTATAVGVADSGFPLAVAGGLLTNSCPLQERLRAELLKRNLQCGIQVVEEPLAGCVRLADKKFSGALVNWHACQ